MRASVRERVELCRAGWVSRREHGGSAEDAEDTSQRLSSSVLSALLRALCGNSEILRNLRRRAGHLEARGAAADLDAELAGLEHAPSAIVDERELPWLEREGHAARFAGGEVHALESLQRADRHANRRLRVGDVELHDL